MLLETFFSYMSNCMYAELTCAFFKVINIQMPTFFSCNIVPEPKDNQELSFYGFNKFFWIQWKLFDL